MLSIGGGRPELLPFISVPLTLIWSCKLLGYAMDVATGELIEEGEHWGLARGTYARIYMCVRTHTHTLNTPTPDHHQPRKTRTLITVRFICTEIIFLQAPLYNGCRETRILGICFYKRNTLIYHRTTLSNVKL